MQKIVTDRLRPEGKRDALGVEQARAQLGEAHAFLDREMTPMERKPRIAPAPSV